MIGPLKKEKLDKKLFEAEKSMLRNKILKLESDLNEVIKDNEDLAIYLHKGLQVHMQGQISESVLKIIKGKKQRKTYREYEKEKYRQLLDGIEGRAPGPDIKLEDIDEDYELPNAAIESLENTEEKKKFKTLLRSAQTKLMSKVTQREGFLGEETESVFGEGEQTGDDEEDERRKMMEEIKQLKRE